MEKNRERRDNIWSVVSRLLAALALVAFFSCPGMAAIKRFTDDKGTLHITDEGGESKSQASTPSASPQDRRTRVKTPQGLPRPGAAPPPPPPRVAPPEPEDRPEEIEEPEEPAEEPAPSVHGRGRR